MSAVSGSQLLTGDIVKFIVIAWSFCFIKFDLI